VQPQSGLSGKLCPRCDLPWPLDAQTCTCGHIFRTQFTQTPINQTQAFTPQLMASPYAPPVRPKSKKPVFAGVLALAVLAAGFGLNAWLSNPVNQIAGRWRFEDRRKESVMQFNRDGTALETDTTQTGPPENFDGVDPNIKPTYDIRETWILWSISGDILTMTFQKVTVNGVTITTHTDTRSFHWTLTEKGKSLTLEVPEQFMTTYRRMS